jgi:2-octaprenylphenol hydroxylase
MTQHQYDIAICGAEMTGLMLANLLKGTNYRIALVDAGPQPSASSTLGKASEVSYSSFASGYSPRVSALNIHSIQLLERCGALEHIERAAPFKEMQIKDSEGTGEICFSTEDFTHADQLGMVVENQLVTQALFRQLEPAENITASFEHRLEELERADGRVEMVLDNGETLVCDLLVGADGGNSKVRELRGSRAVGWQYDQTAIVTTVRCVKAHNSIPRQWFTEFGPLAFLPLADCHLVSIVWSHRDAESVLNLGAPEFCRMLEQASEGDLGEVLATDKRFSFPLRQHHAIRYVEPGIAMIGDAAHTIHPLAGQGANLGLADAAALASEIRQAIFSDSGLADPALLRRFAQRRQPHNLAIAAAIEAIKQLYGQQHPAINFVRNKVMNFLNQTPALKSLMIKVATDSAP